MVRSELLRAKSLHAEVAYLRDLQRVGDAKRNEEKHNSILRDKEHRFWKEAVKGQPANAGLQTTAPSHMQTTAQLERMHQAHSQLKAAHRTHESATQKLNEGLATLSTSQKRIEILEKLVAKAQLIKANQVESRLSEEVADLVTTSRTVMNLRARLGAEAEPRHAPPLGEVGGEGGALVGQTATPGQLLLSMGPQGGAAGQPTLPTIIPSASVQAPAAPSTPVSVGQVGISNVAFSQGQNEPTLSLTCALGTQGTVGLRVSKAETGGGLKVIIDPSASGLASGVLRERSAIQSRLQAMGIKVSTIELGTAGNDSPLTRGSKRSRVHEGEDEDYIS